MSHAEQIEALKGLLERCRAAEGPDREIDCDIARWEGWTQHSDAEDPVYARTVSQWWAEPGCEWSTTSVPGYVTRSVDDAIALVGRTLPDHSWAIGSQHGRFRASLTKASPFRPFPIIEKNGATAGLVLVAALLSAKLALLTQEESR